MKMWFRFYSYQSHSFLWQSLITVLLMQRRLLAPPLKPRRPINFPIFQRWTNQRRRMKMSLCEGTRGQPKVTSKGQSSLFCATLLVRKVTPALRWRPTKRREEERKGGEGDIIAGGGAHRGLRLKRRHWGVITDWRSKIGDGKRLKRRTTFWPFRRGPRRVMGVKERRGQHISPTHAKRT